MKWNMFGSGYRSSSPLRHRLGQASTPLPLKVERRMRVKYSKFWYVVGALLAANIAALVAAQTSRPPTSGKLRFFDVGQGDAIYFRTLEGNDILIDTGPGDVVLSKLGRSMPFWDRQLELVILTHPHADHISGMTEILKRFKVQNVLLPEVKYESATYRETLDRIAANGVSVIRPKLGERIFLDNVTVFDVFYPIISENAEKPKDINDVSIVGRLSFGKMNVLLTGDAGKDIERQLLRLGLPLESEILKVGHHGSKHSTTLEFVSAASSSYAIISVGKNSYGHPSEEVLGLFQNSQTELLRTDEVGDISFEVYPGRIELRD